MTKLRDLQSASLLHHSLQTTDNGGGHPTTNAPVSSGYYLTYASGSGPFHLNINFDASVAKAPAAFVTDVERVADFFTNHFNNATTITINVGYGEVAGYNIGRTALGESITYYSQTTYASLATKFNATSLHDDSHFPRALLPTTDPIAGKHAYWVTTAEGKAIGLLPASSSVDGYIGLSGMANTFDYDTHDGNVTGYDFVGTVAHEISEVMGRQVNVGAKSQGIPGYMPLDLFHYSAEGARVLSGSTPGYFSIDGGKTDYATKAFNTHSNADFGDWAPGTVADSFDASGGLNQVAPVTQVDYLTMEATGWTGTGWTSDWT